MLGEIHDPFRIEGRDRLGAVGGGVTAAAGFRAGALAAGLKPSGKPDLSLVVADEPAAVAVTTTTNIVKAAPCVLTEKHAADGRAQAVVINSGNANACTGPEGMADAEATARAVAGELAIRAEDVLVLSTGIIGVPLDLDTLIGGVPRLVSDLSYQGGARAAFGIMTTDRRSKQVAYVAKDESGSCVVGGMAKGAGMIEPNMATMLAVITTDAPLTGAVLRPLVRQAVERTFNRISIDGCGSTNDTVVVMASGRATEPPGLATFQTALESVCADLAHAIVVDGEGTTRIAELRVTGADSEADAIGLARAVAASVLFRAALHGADPNWGRILAAMGASGIPFDPDRVSVTCGGITVCRYGMAAVFDRGQAATAMSKPEVEIVIDLGRGDASGVFLTSALSPEYVSFNSEYTT